MFIIFTPPKKTPTTTTSVVPTHTFNGLYHSFSFVPGILGSVRTVMRALKEFSNSVRRAFVALKTAIKEISNFLELLYSFTILFPDISN